MGRVQHRCQPVPELQLTSSLACSLLRAVDGDNAPSDLYSGETSGKPFEKWATKDRLALGVAQRWAGASSSRRRWRQRRVRCTRPRRAPPLRLNSSAAPNSLLRRRRAWAPAPCSLNCVEAVVPPRCFARVQNMPASCRSGISIAIVLRTNSPSLPRSPTNQPHDAPLLQLVGSGPAAAAGTPNFYIDIRQVQTCM